MILSYFSVELEKEGYLKPIPLVIIKAISQESPVKPKEPPPEVSDSSESEPEVEDPMPKHFDQEESFPVVEDKLSRSDSATSLDLHAPTTLPEAPRPLSACTDVSDQSMSNVEAVASVGEFDEASFDAASLTCKLCKKAMKNLRTFRNHCARHLGILNHRCPDCAKCFENRGAVNKHLMTGHNRELQHHEITINPAASVSPRRASSCSSRRK